MTVFILGQQMRSRRICLILISGVLLALLSCHVGAQGRNHKGKTTMATLAQLIRSDEWDKVEAYVDERQNAALREIEAIVNDRTFDSTTQRWTYGLLRRIPTLESALLLARGFGVGAGSSAILGLPENPRAEVYPILKAKLRSPEEERGKELLLTMAQMPAPVEERLDDLWPYLEAKHVDARHAAIFGLALLDEPSGMARMARELGTSESGSKKRFLRTFYEFSAWRTPKFVPLLIPVLNDPMRLTYFGFHCHSADCELDTDRYLLARDYALNIIVAILRPELPFRIADNTPYTAEQRELVKQKLRELGYTVTDEPYPATTSR